MTIEAGQTLSHYRLIEKIGEGGMGVVWKAVDTVLNRQVAIKVLPADVSRDDARRQLFLQEAQLAGSISDGRIVQIHEFGREAGLDFIVMEYVDGKPLTKLIHGRPLPPEKVAEFGLEAATALSRAHRKGLIHRDLKPANIMVTSDGDVKVLDFGLAVLFERDETTVLPDEATRTSDQTESTSKGTLAGTLSYMSPEQARCEKLDSRSDIFSLGVILYEMATGQRPFTGATPAQILREIQSSRATPPHQRVRKLPLELDRIIQKTLARRRSNRYQSMEDLAVDLKRLGRELDSGSSPSYEDLAKTSPPSRVNKAVTISVGVLLLLVLAFLGWRFTVAPASPVDDQTILILPMEVRGQAEGAEYFGRAFAEAIAVNLAMADGFKVLPVPSAGLTDAGEAIKLAGDSGAGRLLTGSLTREAEAVHASVSLLDVVDNRILWGAQEDFNNAELPPNAARLAGKVLDHLGLSTRKMYDYPTHLRGSPEMATSSEFIEAIGAMRDWARPSFNFEAALATTQRLIEAFPGEEDAHVLRLLAVSSAYTREPNEENLEVQETQLATLERIAPESPYVDMWHALWVLEWGEDIEVAIPSLDRVLKRSNLTPTMRAWALRQRGGTRRRLGDLEGALDDVRKALTLDPTHYNNYAVLRDTYVRLNRLEEALVTARQVVALVPDSWSEHRELGDMLGQRLGRWKEAVDPYRRACELNPGQDACARLPEALHSAGRHEKAKSEATRVSAMRDTKDGTLALALYYAKAGDSTAALDHLQRALDVGFSGSFLQTVSQFAPLDGDSRFEEIHRVATRREIDRAHEAVALNPGASGPYARLGLAMARLEDWTGAVEAYRKACELDQTQNRCATYAIMLQRVGREAEARETAEAAETMEGALGHYDMACYYALAGERDRAIRHLRRELDRGYRSDWIGRDPDLASLHGDPEFELIVSEAKKRAGVE